MHILKMVIDKSFGGDGDTQTASGVMKGLSPYLFATQTAEEIADMETLKKSKAAPALQDPSSDSDDGLPPDIQM